jgi:hypothetical protein
MQGHSYAVQSLALYVAMIPFATLFTMMIGARFFEGLRRARKPAAQRPAIIAIAPAAPARRFLPAVD